MLDVKIVEAICLFLTCHSWLHAIRPDFSLKVKNEENWTSSLCWLVFPHKTCSFIWHQRLKNTITTTTTKECFYADEISFWVLCSGDQATRLFRSFMTFSWQLTNYYLFQIDSFVSFNFRYTKVNSIQLGHELKFDYRTFSVSRTIAITSAGLC